MEGETTSTSSGTGDEVNKDSDLIEILEDERTVLDHYGPEYLKPEQLLEVLISPGYSGKTPAEVAANLLQTFGDLKDVSINIQSFFKIFSRISLNVFIRQFVDEF